MYIPTLSTHRYISIDTDVRCCNNVCGSDHCSRTKEPLLRDVAHLEKIVVSQDNGVLQSLLQTTHVWCLTNGVTDHSSSDTGIYKCNAVWRRGCDSSAPMRLTQ